ncbi:preprotein translocase subunit SecY [Halorhodospira abdelmalekii]|uniref:preprotein translocase subunit SecY n=1 Tax=Halorhodospira abdelmalekii TaxID=421629 RepID=UPI001908ED3D|nr:preprotein translocase subunit SecY [Halorhodospira abdelmalekii]MBK1734939.1 preprotein translocase subunit SecY [Halorhodospira abdelmalekii]
MARAGGAAAALGGMGKLTEVRQRLLFVLMALIIYRIGTHITIPGIDPAALGQMVDQQRGTILEMFNMFAGGALERLSIFALGVMPYISAAIIMQLLAAVVPSLERLKKEGERGRRKITQYTRYGTLGLATFQGFGISIALQQQGVAAHPGPMFVMISTITLATGVIFLMWLGEQITERGIGNGISIIIFAGIVAGLPSALGGALELHRTGELGTATVLALLTMAAAVTAFVVFVERGQRRITVQYAKRQHGRKMYAAQQSHLPLKLNMAGVIPPIFASSIILFPATLGQWFGGTEGFGLIGDIAATLSPGQPVYVALYAAAIMFFCFFYTALVFNSRDTADNLKRSGAFIPGIRPGEQTARYIDQVMTRLTFVGALYITAVCLMPEFLILYWNVPFYFGGTALLISVIVVMDFMAQLQSHLVSHQYEPLMKKANLKGHKRPGGGLLR